MKDSIISRIFMSTMLSMKHLSVLTANSWLVVFQSNS